MATVIVRKLDQQEFESMGISRWPVWEKDYSRFDWVYEEVEECYFLEGEVDILTENGIIKIVKGDFATFEVGLKCTWDIKKAVKKHYNFK